MDFPDTLDPALLPDQLTFDDLAGPFSEVGLDSKQIKAMEIDCHRLTGRLVLVVTTYDLDSDDKRYFSTLTGEVATEIRRFPLTFLQFEDE